MNQTWGTVRRSDRRRVGRAIWQNGLTILLPVLFFAVSIAYWRGLIAETAQTVANTIEYEDAALCTKFGFAAGTKVHDACKLDLLDLRHRHEQLVAANSVP
jgi:hypothetical protein